MDEERLRVGRPRFLQPLDEAAYLPLYKSHIPLGRIDIHPTHKGIDAR